VADQASASIEERAAPTRRPAGRAPRLGSMDSIREAAARLFLEGGYAATSMDDIAAAAQVSKQTIYTHFANKGVLFGDLVLGNAGRVEEFAAVIASAMNSADEPATCLRNLARQYARFVVRPEVLQLRRLVIGEAGRFPDLARSYFETVVQRTYELLADLFGDLSKRGQLSVEDPMVAAYHFAWLTLGNPLDTAMFRGVEAAVDLDLDSSADAGVRVFLAAYAAI
jgi:TetR/AcrR family transcriptional repressor of mexJK operon